jgi:hypothetical protein
VGVVKRWVLRGLWRRLVGVGIIGPGLLGAPALRFAPLQTPAKVATWHTKIRHLGYVLLSSSVLQSDQSSSRVPSESSPLPERPGFSIACAGGPEPCGPARCRLLRLRELLLYRIRRSFGKREDRGHGKKVGAYAVHSVPCLFFFGP